jgi:4'-phosphopantetheinyl transferase EntD
MIAAPATNALTVADAAFAALPESGVCAALANCVIRLGNSLNGPRFVASVAAIGQVTTRLTPGEQANYARLCSPDRRRGWLAGRAAIKAARERLGLGTDTSAMRFPHPCTSLTHAAGYAIAVAAPTDTLLGIGVDLEMPRATSPEISRFFLTESERRWLEAGPLDQQGDDRIRLWTVKEAVFKALPNNRGTNLARIELDDPEAESGAATVILRAACRGANKYRVKFASERTAAGWVSLAHSPIWRSHE